MSKEPPAIIVIQVLRIPKETMGGLEARPVSVSTVVNMDTINEIVKSQESATISLQVEERKVPGPRETNQVIEHRIMQKYCILQ